MTTFNISEPSAYNNIAASKRLFGDAGRAAKDSSKGKCQLNQIDDLVINSRISDYLNTKIEVPRIKDK